MVFLRQGPRLVFDKPCCFNTLEGRRKNGWVARVLIPFSDSRDAPCPWERRTARVTAPAVVVLALLAEAPRAPPWQPQARTTAESSHSCPTIANECSLPTLNPTNFTPAQQFISTINWFNHGGPYSYQWKTGCGTCAMRLGRGELNGHSGPYRKHRARSSLHKRHQSLRGVPDAVLGVLGHQVATRSSSEHKLALTPLNSSGFSCHSGRRSL